LVRWAAVVGLAVLGCTPKIGTDPVPVSMDFDPTAMPPRAPEPTHAIINPSTMRLDFSLAGISVPADCASQMAMPQAQCEFYHYLQSLDGYPTTTPARAPASVPLDPTTLTPANVVVVDATAGQVVGDLAITFDDVGRYVVITPKKGWEVAHLYFAGVRGYANGVKAADGKEVVAPVPYYLLKQDQSLTCDANTADAIPDTCPVYKLLAQQMAPDAARMTAFQLERLRASYAQLGTTAVLGQVGGIPSDELAVFWAFPTHSAPVAELNPPTAVPSLAGSTITVAVKGALAPATLVPTKASMPGTVTLLDLTAAAGANLAAGLPAFDVAYQPPHIVLTTAQPLVSGHQYGLFLSTGITSPDGKKALVPSPVSFLLTARGPLVDGAGKSQVSQVSNSDAQQLEAGRSALAAVFDNPLIQALTGLDRTKTAYVYAVAAP
jgi:hypothetical protein